MVKIGVQGMTVGHIFGFRRRSSIRVWRSATILVDVVGILICRSSSFRFQGRSMVVFAEPGLGPIALKAFHVFGSRC